MRVVATAGHVDHGKSSLVKALTGTDPDRWEEEKRRGLTIDLGFAFTALPSGASVGFVDVPGHVRFMKNMLAGAGAVRAAMLVVAATEGWMPQSEEHLRILELLGVERGFTVVSKADLVDADIVELAQLETLDHLDGSFLAEAPVVVCDSISGRGLEAVREALDALVAGIPETEDRGRPRLWIDRTFTARGAGTIVTGTLTGGVIDEGSEVELRPSGRRARVRGIQAGHETVKAGWPGSRIALNLAGVAHDAVARGDAVVVPEQWPAVTSFDVAMTLLPGLRLRRRSQLKAYIGSGEYDATVVRLEAPYARILLTAPVPLAPGDRIVLRDSGPDVTVGGGEVLDVAPVAKPAAAARLLVRPLEERIVAGHGVLTEGQFARLAGCTPGEARELLATLTERGLARRVGRHVIDTATARASLDAVTDRVDAIHRSQPLEPGAPLPELARELGLDPQLLAALVEEDDGLVVDGSHVRRLDHTRSAADDPEARRFLDALEQNPFAPPSPEEAGAPAGVVRALEREGVVMTVGDQVMARSAVIEAARLIVGALEQRGEITVAEVRDLLGSSRRFVVPLLGHLDAEGVTRRRGDVRIAGPRAAEAFA